MEPQDGKTEPIEEALNSQKEGKARNSKSGPDGLKMSLLRFQPGDLAGTLQELAVELDQWRDKKSSTGVARLAEACRVLAEHGAPEGSVLLGRDRRFWALLEAIELSIVYGRLRPMKREEMAPLFRRAFHRSDTPAGEDHLGSNLGRNTMFQLWLGSALRAAGGQVLFEDPPDDPSDLRLKIEEGEVLIECKRPFTFDSMRQAILTARRQLKRRLTKSPPGTAGLVAVSVSRALLSQDTGVVKVRELEDIALMYEALHRIHEEYWPIDKDEDFRERLQLGIIYHLNLPVFQVDEAGEPTDFGIANLAFPVLTRAPSRHLWPRTRGRDFIEVLLRAIWAPPLESATEGEGAGRVG